MREGLYGKEEEKDDWEGRIEEYWDGRERRGGKRREWKREIGKVREEEEERGGRWKSKRRKGRTEDRRGEYSIR